MQRGVFDRHGQTVDKGRTLRIVNPGMRKAAFNAVERVHGHRWRSVVVALQGLHKLGCRSDDGDTGDIRPQRQDVPGIFQQHHGLAGGLQRLLPVLGGVDHAEGDAP